MAELDQARIHQVRYSDVSLYGNILVRAQGHDNREKINELLQNSLHCIILKLESKAYMPLGRSHFII